MPPAKARPARAAKAPAAKDDRLDLAVYGATGFTGRLAAEAAERAGLDFILGGRDESRLRGVAAELGGEHPYQVARHDDPTELRALASRARVLASTAGPFAEVGELAVAAAVDAGTHYLDSTGEVDFMAQTFRRHHEQAKRKGIVVINACAHEYVFGDCAVSLALEAFPGTREMRVSYWIPNKAITRGTALTTLRMFSSPLFGAHQARPAKVRFPQPPGDTWVVSYPGGEAELLRRRRPDVSITTCMDVPHLVARSAPAMPALGMLMRLPGVGSAAQRFIESRPAGPPADVRARQEFVIFAEVDPGLGGGHGIAVRGTDPYGLTGELLARCARLLLRGENQAAGVLSPSEAFPPGPLLDSLADLGVSWERV